MIDYGAEVNTVFWQVFSDGVGYSSFHCIFMKYKDLDPSRNIIELLIEHGANINAVTLGDDDGYTPLQYAMIRANGMCAN